MAETSKKVFVLPSTIKVLGMLTRYPRVGGSNPPLGTIFDIREM